MKIHLFTFLIYILSQSATAQSEAFEKKVLFNPKKKTKLYLDNRPKIIDSKSDGFLVLQEDMYYKYDDSLNLEWKADISKNKTPIYKSETTVLKHKGEYYACNANAPLALEYSPLFINFSKDKVSPTYTLKEKVKYGVPIGAFANDKGVHILLYSKKSPDNTYVLYSLDTDTKKVSMQTIALPTNEFEIDKLQEAREWHGWKYQGQIAGRALFAKANFDDNGGLLLETIEIDNNNKVINYDKQLSKSQVPGDIKYIAPKIFFKEEDKKLYALGYYGKKNAVNMVTGTYLASYTYNDQVYRKVDCVFSNLLQTCQDNNLGEATLNITSEAEYDQINDIFRIWSADYIMNGESKHTNISLDNTGQVIGVSYIYASGSVMYMPTYYSANSSHSIAMPYKKPMRPNPVDFIYQNKLEGTEDAVAGYLTHKNSYFYVFTLRKEDGQFACYKVKS